MKSWVFFGLIALCLLILSPPNPCVASVRKFGKLNPGFQGSQMDWIDNDGLFLLSNDSNFAFGFLKTNDVTLFLLGIFHMTASRIVWSANRASPVRNSDKFAFDSDGNAYLTSNGTVIWSSGTANKGVTAMEMLNSGNLLLVGTDGSMIWQSFSQPTDTILTNQEFTEGMKLVSDPNDNNLTFSLEIKSGDMFLSADFRTPQPYWSMSSDNRKTINQDGGDIILAEIESNSWRFYDKSRVFFWQFIFADDGSENNTWAAVLGNDGFITFYLLSSQSNEASKKIPDDPCSRPEPCAPYSICHDQNICQCPRPLSLLPNCDPNTGSVCDRPGSPIDLVSAGDGVSYFAVAFVSPVSKTDLNSCKDSCTKNCSCVALFYDNSTGNCFVFDQIGSLKGFQNGTNLESFIKVLGSGTSSPSGGSSNSSFPYVVVVIAVSTVLLVVGLLYLGFRYHVRKKNQLPGTLEETSEEDNFLESISGMPIRFGYKDLQAATENFSVKLGQGGFGSVYRGVLQDGTRVAVKQLEGIGQGKKEFRAEVSIIGSIHHHHLVRLRGFCAEGSHRLLVYEYMANGSLDRWIFRRSNDDYFLDWDTRFNIAIGTAKGLAYLHEDCDVKIVHCDIKPENVLLDDNFQAKVSDFGLAKLMTREQSHVFTTLRGTRGYLAPEWITNYAISEKSDVYSYGMVLLEIIGGRKNYDASETSEKSHFPSYAFKMMEEGKPREIFDAKLKIDENDERVWMVIRVALWCIQDDTYLRPSMAKVVQMLEGLCPVPPPPTASQMGSRFYSTFFKSISEEGTGTSSGPSDCNSDAYLSAVRLSGPR